MFLNIDRIFEELLKKENFWNFNFVDLLTFFAFLVAIRTLYYTKKALFETEKSNKITEEALQESKTSNNLTRNIFLYETRRQEIISIINCINDFENHLSECIELYHILKEKEVKSMNYALYNQKRESFNKAQIFFNTQLNICTEMEYYEDILSDLLFIYQHIKIIESHENSIDNNIAIFYKKDFDFEYAYFLEKELNPHIKKTKLNLIQKLKKINSEIKL